MRVAVLACLAALVSAESAPWEAEMAALRQEVAELKAMMTAQPVRTHVRGRRLQTGTTTVDLLQAALDDINSVDSRVDTANTAIATNTASINTANANIATITANVATNTASINTANTNIATANANIATHTENIASNTASITSVSGRVTVEETETSQRACISYQSCS
jgi:chromosome segregation ATPase